MNLPNFQTKLLGFLFISSIDKFGLTETNQ